MKKTFDLVLFSTFASIILFLALIPNIGYITFIPGLSSVTIIHIPVLIGIMLLPLHYSIALGFVFGLSSFIASFLYASSLFDFAFQNPLVSFIPRIIFALVAFYIIKGLTKLKDTKHGKELNFSIVFLAASIFISFGSYTLVNFLGWPFLIVGISGLALLILFIYLYFKFINNRYNEISYVPTAFIVSTLVHTLLVLVFVAVIKIDAYEGGNVLDIILFILGTNGLIESLLALFIGTPIVVALYHVKEEKL